MYGNNTTTDLYREKPAKSLDPSQCSNDIEILRASNILKGISFNQFLNDRGGKKSELESTPKESIPALYGHWEQFLPPHSHIQCAD